MFSIGRSTTAQLISRAKSMNEYNNSAVANDAVWVDFFNQALAEMVEDLSIEEVVTINYVAGTREYDLPEDYYGVIDVYEIISQDYKPNVYKRRAYNSNREGYWILNKAGRNVIDFQDYLSDTTFDVFYIKYPAQLDSSQASTQKPEVYTAAENALVYKAIINSLRNNNQFGQAREYEQLYSEALKTAKAAYNKARGF